MSNVRHTERIMRIDAVSGFLSATPTLRLLRVLGYLNVGAIAASFWMAKSPSGSSALLWTSCGVAIVGAMLFGVLHFFEERQTKRLELWQSFRPYVLSTVVILGLTALIAGAKWAYRP